MSEKRKASIDGDTDRGGEASTALVKRIRVSEEIEKTDLTPKQGGSRNSSEDTVEEPLPARNLTFLNLPGEVRNEIYKWVLPRPESPKLLCIAWMCDDLLAVPVWGIGGEPLALEIYEVCKTIHQECPSLTHLLGTGAIIPTVTIDAWAPEENWCDGVFSTKFLRKTLMAASHLRIRCRNSFEGPDDFLFSEWASAADSSWFMETFLGHPPFTRSWLVNDDVGTSHDIEEAIKFASPTKTLQICAELPFKDLKLGWTKCLDSFLEVIIKKELLKNISTVQIRAFAHKFQPTILRKLNDQIRDAFEAHRNIHLTKKVGDKVPDWVSSRDENEDSPALHAGDFESAGSEKSVDGDEMDHEGLWGWDETDDDEVNKLASDDDDGEANNLTSDDGEQDFEDDISGEQLHSNNRESMDEAGDSENA